MRRVFFKANFICFVIAMACSLALIDSSFSITRKSTIKIKGTTCLKKLEQYTKTCSKGVSKLKTKRDSSCRALKKEVNRTCNPKRLECSSRDPIVCANTFPCPVGAACVVGPIYREFKNVCELFSESTGFEFSKRGKCIDSVMIDPVSCGLSDIKPVCGISTSCDLRGIMEPSPDACIPSPPRWFDSLCELNEAGATQVEDSKCKAACADDNKRVCGTPAWSCKEGMYCLAVMPRPQWYKNICHLKDEGATLTNEELCNIN